MFSRTSIPCKPNSSCTHRTIRLHQHKTPRIVYPGSLHLRYVGIVKRTHLQVLLEEAQVGLVDLLDVGRQGEGRRSGLHLHMGSDETEVAESKHARGLRDIYMLIGHGPIHLRRSAKAPSRFITAHRHLRTLKGRRGERPLTCAMYLSRTVLLPVGGGAWTRTMASSQRLSSPVDTRRFQDSYECTTAGKSARTPAPVTADVGSTRTPPSCATSSGSSFNQVSHWQFEAFACTDDKEDELV